jgi:hypothetical protein
MYVHLTLKSSNAKTGPIPVSTSSRDTCPDSCNLKKNGCYADSGPLALHWDKVTREERGTDWNTFCATIASLPAGQFWRHNQAGDLPITPNGKIDTKLMAQLINANKGKNGFTYTHHDMSSAKNRLIVQTANNGGFTVNLSAESLSHADQLADLNIGPVVTIIDDKVSLLDGKPVHIFSTPKGRTVVTCPATYKDNVSCATCQLCGKQRDVIVAFPVHGTGKAKARKVFQIKSV